MLNRSKTIRSVTAYHYYCAQDTITEMHSNDITLLYCFTVIKYRALLQLVSVFLSMCYGPY